MVDSKNLPDKTIDYIKFALEKYIHSFLVGEKVD
jgi:hypothetical protein